MDRRSSLCELLLLTSFTAALSFAKAYAGPVTVGFSGELGEVVFGNTVFTEGDAFSGSFVLDRNPVPESIDPAFTSVLIDFNGDGIFADRDRTYDYRARTLDFQATIDTTDGANDYQAGYASGEFSIVDDAPLNFDNPANPPFFDAAAPLGRSIAPDDAQLFGEDVEGVALGQVNIAHFQIFESDASPGFVDGIEYQPDAFFDNTIPYIFELRYGPDPVFDSSIVGGLASLDWTLQDAEVDTDGAFATLVTGSPTSLTTQVLMPAIAELMGGEVFLNFDVRFRDATGELTVLINGVAITPEPIVGNVSSEFSSVSLRVPEGFLLGSTVDVTFLLDSSADAAGVTLDLDNVRLNTGSSIAGFLLFEDQLEGLDRITNGSFSDPLAQGWEISATGQGGVTRTVPLPSSFALICIGLLGVSLRRRLRR
ncbi:MAG: PEP-CTERM sorting domain-containing protein [Pseudomonadota bacterium]